MALSPFLILNAVFVGFALVEWGILLRWKRLEKRIRGEILETLPPASDRWKPASLAGVTLVTIAGEIWLDVLTESGLGIGVTILGVSSMATLWYAWSRPLLILNNGLMVGAGLVPWNDVKRVLWQEGGKEGTARLELTQPHFFYGTKLRFKATPEQFQRIASLLHDSLAPEEYVAKMTDGTA